MTPFERMFRDFHAFWEVAHKRRTTFRWCGQELSLDEGRYGLLAVGVQGSGKSTLMKIAMGDIAEAGDSIAAMDLSGDLETFFRWRLGPEAKIVLFDSRSRRGAAVDYAAILTSETAIDRFVKMVLPLEAGGGGGAFFDRAAQMLVMTAMLVLNHYSPRKWTLGDAIRLACWARLLNVILIKTPTVFNPFPVMGLTRGSSKDVLATVLVRLWPLRIEAALSEHCRECVSPLAVFDGPPAVAIMRMRDDSKHAQAALYPFIFDTIGDHALSRPVNRRVWIGADEVAAVEKINLADMVRRGRKSALGVMVATQEVASLRQKYGKDGTEELLGLLNYKAILKCGSPESADYLSRYLGTCEVIEDLLPWNALSDWRPSIKDRRNVTPDELRRLPLADPAKDRIDGYYDSPKMTCRFSIPFLDDVDHPPIPHEDPVPKEWEHLLPMTEGRMIQLMLPFDADVQKVFYGKDDDADKTPKETQRTMKWK